MYKVDLNCDMGENFGIYNLGQDEELMKYITSTNIACGYHAGDPMTMRKTVKLALQYGVAIGAHPGLPDMAGFGRRIMDISAEEIYGLVLYQIGALQAFAKAEGTSITHVKPHGALYQMANQNTAIAEAIAEAVYRIDGDVYLVGQSSSKLVKAGARAGLRTLNEVFADRNYEKDGSLTPRSHEQALIVQSKYAAERVIRMVLEHKVESRTGEEMNMRADTICVHGDSPDALEHVIQLSQALSEAGIEVVHPV
ncbi:MAG: LamB/YcsF family protein [Candidatus Pristimantibacillus lignocellulolyticus]|uniref:5-oxoprolinase subunit A n=1 Tax=Candidatus Pristimantibacillus lignocellulolyticus TaxID=2994561 RepID=A0A9J6ZG37_9BACL|nr:MAG: LamB/YcsF family protein [Candidatus Pristimantibacillus lignocellulolyticus]